MPNNVEWAATLRDLASSGNEVALEATEAREIADLLIVEPGGDDNGEGS